MACYLDLGNTVVVLDRLYFSLGAVLSAFWVGSID